MPKWLTILLAVLFSIGLVFGLGAYLLREDQIEKMREEEEKREKESC